MIKSFVRWLFRFILKIVDWILSLVLQAMPFNLSDNLVEKIQTLSIHINHFYGYCMKYFQLARSMLDINKFEMGLIAELLSITLLYKPILLIIKLVVRWIKSLK